MSEVISPNKAKATHWRGVVEQQAASGKSICKFCLEDQINPHTFRYWRAKFLRNVSTAGKIQRSRFIAVARGDLKSAAPRIALPNGVTIDLGCGLDSPSVNQFLLRLCGVGLNGGPHAKS
jgi:hypothetical protein